MGAEIASPTLWSSHPTPSPQQYFGFLNVPAFSHNCLHFISVKCAMSSMKISVSRLETTTMSASAWTQCRQPAYQLLHDSHGATQYQKGGSVVCTSSSAWNPPATTGVFPTGAFAMNSFESKTAVSCLLTGRAKKSVHLLGTGTCLTSIILNGRGFFDRLFLVPAFFVVSRY